MIQAIGILLVCQLAGEIIARGLGLSVPGPVIGLVLLFAGLVVLGARSRSGEARIEGSALDSVSTGLLREFGLFFIPAGAGVIQYLGLVTRYGLGLGLALVVSTVLTLVVTVWVFIGVAKWTRSGRPPEA
ncbi:CidA/LrgA family protein [Kaistia dalseonensis]|uniref:Effector of murein hydrolase LrgA (UPF0299 family) n=1 Tax=Kaistia dalseonensis TaxID=410840 RepID=A0ABU0H7D1_9HYPH|nr:CidA/LrgA family protein [Kaistia dalseonensis]MCX5495622.1 CidA/LrgA family protein [Kaistia dalseonensis]MDQ0438215.1 putative effector of murein hydrolase LrgA (UPF0299 family) [Kaistia dalseonensis]